MLTNNVASATWLEQQPAYQGKCWQRSYSQCIWQWLALGSYVSCQDQFLWRFDKYEYWKGKCVKSVLGQFSSAVSICRNKGTQSDLGVPFLSGSPPAGGTGALPPALPTGPRVVRSNFCNGGDLSWKKAKRKFWDQQVVFGTKFLKFGPQTANLVTLFPP